MSNAFRSSSFPKDLVVDVVVFINNVLKAIKKVIFIIKTHISDHFFPESFF